jgi:hypothetical protein
MPTYDMCSDIARSLSIPGTADGGISCVMIVSLSMEDQDDQLPDDEIAERMERGIRRFLNTPPQPHGKNPKAPAPKPKPKRSVKKTRPQGGAAPS